LYPEREEFRQDVKTTAKFIRKEMWYDRIKVGKKKKCFLVPMQEMGVKTQNGLHL
jgi:hypothetical protein